jgi:hypothetical protein
MGAKKEASTITKATKNQTPSHVVVRRPFPTQARAARFRELAKPRL